MVIIVNKFSGIRYCYNFDRQPLRDAARLERARLAAVLATGIGSASISLVDIVSLKFINE